MYIPNFSLFGPTELEKHTHAILGHMQHVGTRLSKILRSYWVSSAVMDVHTKFQLIWSNRTRETRTRHFGAYAA